MYPHTKQRESSPRDHGCAHRRTRTAHMESFIEATNAAVGTAVSKLATYPLDIVKTRLALAEAGASLASVVADLTKEKGVVGLYFGVENKLLKSCGKVHLLLYLSGAAWHCGNEQRPD